MTDRKVAARPNPVPCWNVDLGCRDFVDIWELQKRLVASRQKGAIPDVLLFVEHPPTYTIGRGGNIEHLLVSKLELEKIGVTLVETDRGGDITFHGPGQIVGYPILDLNSIEPDVHHYLRRLEDVLVRALARFDIKGRPVDGLTGVWHSQGKVAAIGVRVSRWVTSHGFALNVSTDLSYFNRIVPCGIFGKAVTSMESILGDTIPLVSVRGAVSAEFGKVFDRRVMSVSEETLIKATHVPVG